MRNPPTVKNETTKSLLRFVSDEPVLGRDRCSVFFGSAEPRSRSRVTVIGRVVVMTLGDGKGGSEEDLIW